MTLEPILPPRLQRFVSEQLASGRFHTEDELILAALALLEQRSLPHQPSGVSLKEDIDPAPYGQPPPGTVRQSLQGSQERPPAGAGAGRAAPGSPAGRRSPRGILADLRSGLSPDDFRQARNDLWSGSDYGGP